MIVDDPIVNLSETTEFRQAIEMRPPTIVHGTLLFIVLILSAGVIWAYFTETEIVVRAQGRIRPADAPQESLSDVSGERVTALVGGHVAEVFFEEGDKVAKDDIILRLDTQSIENEISALNENIGAGKKARQALDRLFELQQGHYLAEKAKREAELERVSQDINQKIAQRLLDIESTKLRLHEAERKEKRLKGELDNGEPGELERLQNLSNLLVQQHKAEQEGLQAQIEQAKLDTQRLKSQREIDIKRAELALAEAEKKEKRFKELQASGDVTQEEYEAAVATRKEAGFSLEEAKQLIDESRPLVLDKQLTQLDKKYALEIEQANLNIDKAREAISQAIAARKEAKLKLTQVQMPVGESPVEIARQQLQEFEKQHEREVQELTIRIDNKNGDVEASRLKKANLEIERDQARIIAPSSGTLTSGALQPGDVVEPRQLVATIAQQTSFRIDVLVAANEVGRINEGMLCRVKLDAFDYQKYGSLEGKVDSISTDSVVLENGAAAFLVKVTLSDDTIGSGDNIGTIKLGMTGTAEIITEVEKILALAFRSLRRGTDVS